MSFMVPPNPALVRPTVRHEDVCDGACGRWSCMAGGPA